MVAFLFLLLIVTQSEAALAATTMSLESWIHTANELLQRHAAMGALPPAVTPTYMLNRTRPQIVHDLTSWFRAHVYWRALAELENVVIIEERPELRHTDVVARVMAEWKARGFQVTHVVRESKYILHLR